MPSELVAEPTRLSTLASRYSLSLVGPDREIVAFGSLPTRSAHRDRLLTYARSAAHLSSFLESDAAACVTHDSLIAGTPHRVSLLVTAADPAAAFYGLFADAVRSGRWSAFPAFRGTGASIASSARIFEPVVIGDDAVIMDNVVILPRTYIADRVTIKPNTTIGGDGFQVQSVHGRRMVVPHAGGVVIGDDVSLGSQVCIDRGLFGEMTVIGSGSAMDNLVHVAHSGRVGSDCSIAASTTLAGSVRLGDGVSLGVGGVIAPGVAIGDYGFVGAGAAVIRDLPAQAVAYGVPARVRGWRCVCGDRLEVVDGRAACTTCGRRFELGDNIASSVE